MIMPEVNKFLWPLDKKNISNVQYLNKGRAKKNVLCQNSFLSFPSKWVSIATRQLKHTITKETCARPVLAIVKESSVATSVEAEVKTDGNISNSACSAN